MKRVIIESPYKGNVKINEMYCEFALRDCLTNYNESPFASHLLYTRKYVLRDHIADERKLGINAGFCWRDVAEKTVFYNDLGMSSGMVEGEADCKKKRKDYEIRNLPKHLWNEFIDSMEKEGIEVIRKGDK